MEKQHQTLSINWFGGMLVARHILAWTKGAVDEGQQDCFIAKMNRPNWIQRVALLTQVLNSVGPTLEAAQLIQGDGKGFFTGVSAEALVEKLTEAVDELRSGGIFKFRAGEFGSLEFENVPGLPQESE